MFLQNKKRGKQKREFRQKRKDGGLVSFYESKKPVGLQKRGACQRRGSGSRLFDSGKRLDQTKVFSTNCCACSGAFPSQF